MNSSNPSAINKQFVDKNLHRRKNKYCHIKPLMFTAYNVSEYSTWTKAQPTHTVKNS